MHHPTIAVIGAGNMGKSLLGALMRHGTPTSHLWATSPHPEKLTHLAQMGIHTTTDNETAIQAADVVIFAVKPPILETIAPVLQPVIAAHQPLVISVASGIRTETLHSWLGQDIDIIRAMPNTPAMIGCGATALFAASQVNADTRHLAQSLFTATGLTLWVDKEEQLDIVTALSGSGPAYFFLLMEALEQAAEQLGLPQNTAHLLTIQTALGAARLAQESDETPAALRKKVTSPGGTTEKAISVLENNHIRATIASALEAAKNRAAELANLLKKE